MESLRLLGWSRGSRQTLYGCQEIMGAQQPRSSNRAMLSADKRLTDFFAPRVPEPFFKHRAALCGQSRGGAQEALRLDGRRNRTSVAREAMELKASPTAAMITQTQHSVCPAQENKGHISVTTKGLNKWILGCYTEIVDLVQAGTLLSQYAKSAPS